jgi:hypothetical protein
MNASTNALTIPKLWKGLLYPYGYQTATGVVYFSFFRHGSCERQEGPLMVATSIPWRLKLCVGKSQSLGEMSENM